MQRARVPAGRRFRLVAAKLVATLVAASAGCGDGGGDVGLGCGAPATVAVLSAFPAELAPLVEAASIEETVVDAHRTVRVGRLGGVRVVLAMTGIGFANAEATTRFVLERFAADAVLVSGVAGSVYRIADVTVPEVWLTPEGDGFAADPELLALARDVAGPDGPVLERCTIVPPDVSSELVCMGFQPEIRVGGIGASEDPYSGQPVVCSSTGGEVFGCDVTSQVVPLPEGHVAIDMETAVIAREALARGVPYVAFRAVSDGEEDPLGLPGFPAQFFAYYPLAAQNAATATIALLERLAGGACF
jgi:nucleoside phosphorylase